MTAREATRTRPRRETEARSFASAGLSGLTPLVLAALALAGVIVSSYLTYTHFADKSIVCAGFGQCDYVNSSDYAKLAGVPVALLGLMAYATMFVVALLWRFRPQEDLWPVAFWGLALAGAGYAAYLTYVEVAVLKAICVWCVVSAVILTATLLIATVHVLLAPLRASNGR